MDRATYNGDAAISRGSTKLRMIYYVGVSTCVHCDTRGVA